MTNPNPFDEITRCTLKIQTGRGEKAFRQLITAALVDIKRREVKVAGTHVTGVGYYRIETDEIAMMATVSIKRKAGR